MAVRPVMTYAMETVAPPPEVPKFVSSSDNMCALPDTTAARLFNKNCQKMKGGLVLRRIQ